MTQLNMIGGYDLASETHGRHVPTYANIDLMPTHSVYLTSFISLLQLISIYVYSEKHNGYYVKIITAKKSEMVSCFSENAHRDFSNIYVKHYNKMLPAIF